MSELKNKLSQKIQEWRPRTQKLLKEYGDVKIDEVTISQVIGGMRDIKSLVTDISYLDPQEGIRFRGYTIPDVLANLPKPDGKEMPYVEGLFYLLLTGEIPSIEDVKLVINEFKKRSRVPQYIIDMLRGMPRDMHPMTMFSAAVLAMQRESLFAKQYHEGINKNLYWEPTFEDALNLIAKLPEIASYIFRMKYRADTVIHSDKNLDFGADFANMMGVDAPFDDVARLYFILHSDHESGNVSAHIGHLVSSALSDIYYAMSSMLNGLSGPLHGLANQEVLAWIQNVKKNMGDKMPNDDEMRTFVWNTLKSGQVIPGYGHAVLRKTDPRYTAQREFCLKYLSDDILFKYVDQLYRIVPDVLREQGKAKNPWPNVDAQSGVILWHYGIKEYDFYTVMFGIGRALGVAANIIWARALGYPIERPKSVTTEMLEEWAGIS